ncbi:MAG: PilZ domain-containing protein [Desulfoprunum sp.]|nr:PilZ domain-containing protein [Desulfoprunum sp.]
MDETVFSQDLRSEHRVDISSIILPFLGSREDDFTPFQYILADLSLHGAKVLLPSWLSRRDRLSLGDEVDFHAPFRFGGETYTSGCIVWERWDKEFDAQSCGVRFDRKKPAIYPVAISFDDRYLDIDLAAFHTPEGLVSLVIKDAVLLKRGIRIYLKHLAPYLSRISGIDKDQYALLRAFLLEEPAAHVARNQKRLEKVLEVLSDPTFSQADLASYIDIEELLDVFEPEIPADVFMFAFQDEAIAPYLRSIKMLEKKLYNNYNTLMMLYVHSF